MSHGRTHVHTMQTGKPFPSSPISTAYFILFFSLGLNVVHTIIGALGIVTITPEEKLKKCWNLPGYGSAVNCKSTKKNTRDLMSFFFVFFFQLGQCLNIKNQLQSGIWKFTDFALKLVHSSKYISYIISSWMRSHSHTNIFWHFTGNGSASIVILKWYLSRKIWRQHIVNYCKNCRTTAITKHKKTAESLLVDELSRWGIT